MRCYFLLLLPSLHPLSSIRSQTMPSPSRPSWSCWHSTPSSTCYWYGTSRGCGLVAMASGSHSTSHCSRPTGWTGRHGVIARPGSPEGGGDRLELETPLSLSLSLSLFMNKEQCNGEGVNSCQYQLKLLILNTLLASER